MGLEYEINGVDKVQESLSNAPDVFRQKLTSQMQETADKVKEYIQSEKLSGQVLNVGDGVLKDSLFTEVQADDNTITGRVATNVVYAGIQEYGGKIDIRGKLSKAKNANKRTLKSYTITIPSRSYMRSALADMLDVISADLEDATSEAAELI